MYITTTYVHTYIRTCVHMYLHTDTNKYIHVYIQQYAYIPTHTNAYIHTFKHTTGMCVCVFVSNCACLSVCIFCVGGWQFFVGLLLYVCVCYECV